MSYAIGGYMFISEIPEGTEVEISIIKADNRMNLKTVPMQLSNFEEKIIAKLMKNFPQLQCIPLEVILQDDQVVGFPTTKEIHYELSCTISGRYYVWKTIIIKNVKLSTGRDCCLVLSPTSVNPVNRRDSYRLWIGKEVDISLGLGGKKYRAILKDLSATGMGVLVSDGTKCKVGTSMHVLYIDRDTEAEKDVTFNLTGKIVNVVELSEGKWLVGCRFAESSPAIEKYVSKKQYEKARENRSK